MSVKPCRDCGGLVVHAETCESETIRGLRAEVERLKAENERQSRRTTELELVIERLTRERDAMKGERDAVDEHIADCCEALTLAGATGHDLIGDVTQGIASLVEQRDEAREQRNKAQADAEYLRDRAEKAEAERDAARAETATVQQRLDATIASLESMNGLVDAARADSDEYRRVAVNLETMRREESARAEERLKQLFFRLKAELGPGKQQQVLNRVFDEVRNLSALGDKP